MHDKVKNCYSLGGTVSMYQTATAGNGGTGQAFGPGPGEAFGGHGGGGKADAQAYAKSGDATADAYANLWTTDGHIPSGGNGGTGSAGGGDGGDCEVSAWAESQLGIAEAFAVGNGGNGGKVTVMAYAKGKTLANVTAVGTLGKPGTGPAGNGTYTAGTVRGIAVAGAVTADSDEITVNDGNTVSIFETAVAGLKIGVVLQARLVTVSPQMIGAARYDSLVQTGGDLDASRSLTLAAGATYAMSGGTATTPLMVNNGTFRLSGGTVTAGTLQGTGSVAISGGLMQLTSQPSPWASNTVGSLAIDAAAGGGPAGTMDLGNGKLTVAYGTNASPAAAVQGWLAGGYNGGAWTGPGISSSAVAADVAAGQSPVTALGWTDDGAGTLTIAYTLAGDTNLDGKVNISDLANLSTNYNLVGQGWAQGDSTYDGSVDSADLAVLASNFGLSLFPTPMLAMNSLSTSDEFAPLLTFADQVGEPQQVESILEARGVAGPGVRSALAVTRVAGGGPTAVPEPAAAGLLATATAGLVGRPLRRGRRRR